jgi:CheY-like chemotaxis protein
MLTSNNTEKSVLVVDDDLVNRKVMSAILTKLGHKVTLAEDGSIAVDACEKEAFDIVLMDISMPVMDGYKAVETIRTIKGYKINETPIIALTAFALDGDREKCLSSGFNDYLSKPIEISELASGIAEWA